MKAAIILPGATDIPNDCELLIAVGKAAMIYEADWWVPGDDVDSGASGNPKVWAPLGSSIEGARKFGGDSECRVYPAAAAVLLASVEGCDAVELSGDPGNALGAILVVAMRRNVSVKYEGMDEPASEPDEELELEPETEPEPIDEG